MVKTSKITERGILVKFATFFVRKWKFGLLVWLTILVGGGFIYSSVIQREGFPPISFPVSFISGNYFVDDAEKVDKDVTLPISEAIKDLELIEDVEVSAAANFFTVQVGLDESLSSDEGTKLISETIMKEANLPESVQLSFAAIDPGSFLLEYDMLVQVYATGSQGPEVIDKAAEYVAQELAALDIISRADAKPNVKESTNSQNGQSESFQTTFDRVGVSTHGSDQVTFYGSTTIGIDRATGEDIIELSEAVQTKLADIDLSQYGAGMETIQGADFAKDIENQINFLQINMLTGLFAVALVSLLLITWRASIITALFMLTVMVSTIVVLHIVGYTLNTITLFALILSLGLFVDDATIVVEAIDVGKRNKKRSAIEVIGNSVKRVGAASLSGTLTTVLVFAILATPTGILGEFIRLIPVTVVIALILSYILSITLIPLLSKFIILENRESDWVTRNNPILKVEEWLSRLIEGNINRLHRGGGKLIAFGALALSGVMIISGIMIFGLKVDSNTFPPAKDSDDIAVEVIFPPGTTINQAEQIAINVENVMVESVGDQVIQAIYSFQQQANNRSATLWADLVPFTERDIRAPELVTELQDALDKSDIQAQLIAAQVDNGPPASQFPFGIRVVSENLSELRAATADISKELVGQELENFNGEKINILESRINGIEGQILRENGNRYAIVTFAFDNSNPTLVTMLGEERFREIYTPDRLEQLGISDDNIVLDAGQEGDFQDSFNTLILAIPVALLLMYVLLAVQFRSIMQPFLILLAIPFTIFGVAVGLFATDNAASFFALTGFIGLIGIAVNNTIMLTDYSNQERRAGKGAIEAIAAASQKRLRPLIATSITTVVALLPLALSDPFWEGLAFTIIFGLLSSTFLVIISFPYYYLLLEYVRRKTIKIFRRA